MRTISTRSYGLMVSLLLSFTVAASAAPINGQVAIESVNNGVSGAAFAHCAEMMAGQHMYVGDVCLSVVGENLILDYTTFGGWYISETHAWAGVSPMDIPQNRQGNPINGHFPYKAADIDLDSFQVVVPLTAFGSSLSCGVDYYFAAHTVVYQLVNNMLLGAETSWSAGSAMSGRNWATYSSFQFACDTSDEEDEGGRKETAFALLSGQNQCFLDLEIAETTGNGRNTSTTITSFNRWGWTNGPLGSGRYVMDVYAAAGQCDLGKGVRVGELVLEYNGTQATVTLTAFGDAGFSEVHLYAGSEILPRGSNGSMTVAPGQYTLIETFASPVQSSVHVIDGLSGNIHFVGHAVAVGDY